MNRQKEQYRREDLEKLPSPQLDAILCAELEKECADRNMILGILEILDEREKDAPLPDHSKVTEAKALYCGWNEGASFEREDKRKKNRWIANVAVIALMLFAFSTIVPEALGAENVFDLFARWTEDIFAFLSPVSEVAVESETEYIFRTDNPGLQQLYDTVTGLGVTQPVVPQWLPAGYELERIKVEKTQQYECVHACFISGVQEISIAVRLLRDDYELDYHKDKIDVEIYECGGVRHYIMGNESAVQTVWHTENIECLLLIADRFNLQQIIASVYGEE